MKEYMILFDPDKCTQCHGCETACKQWRELPYGVRFRRVYNLWTGTFPEVKSASLSLACLHCVDPACAAACPVDAITKSEADGRVLVDEDLCIGCRACAKACPFGVPQFDADRTMRKCDLCLDQPGAGVAPPCVQTCSGHALTLAEVTEEEKRARETAVSEILKQGGVKFPTPGRPRKRGAAPGKAGAAGR